MKKGFDVAQKPRRVAWKAGGVVWKGFRVVWKAFLVTKKTVFVSLKVGEMVWRFGVRPSILRFVDNPKDAHAEELQGPQGRH